jgi:DNA-directed RNA polymerase specialized sigma24 family protein
MEVITMEKLDSMLTNNRFITILNSSSQELKNFCKRIAKRCQDKAYGWEDFFSEACLGMWEQFSKDKDKRNVKQYVNRGKWEVYHIVEKINAAKRKVNLSNLTFDEKRPEWDGKFGFYFEDEENPWNPQKPIRY